MKLTYRHKLPDSLIADFLHSIQDSRQVLPLILISLQLPISHLSTLEISINYHTHRLSLYLALTSCHVCDILQCFLLLLCELLHIKIHETISVYASFKQFVFSDFVKVQLLGLFRIKRANHIWLPW